MSSASEWPRNLPKSSSHPSVSIVTPTYNRRAFIPYLIDCIKQQTYPRERMEWIVLDDGSDSIEDLLEPHKSALNIRYIRETEKRNVGYKRNKLNDVARGEIIVCMDDDDYYFPDRVAHVVHSLRSNTQHKICGSSRVYLYYTDDKSIWHAGPYAPFHATFGTMGYWKQYAKDHPCDETVTHAEEIGFTKKYKEPLTQLDPRKVILVICHTQNTIDKRKLRSEDNPMFKKTSFKLKDFVQSAKHREFYTSLQLKTT
jgi:glycosyltransferase involved in cell wall biosynthesis